MPRGRTAGSTKPSKPEAPKSTPAPSQTAHALAAKYDPAIYNPKKYVIVSNVPEPGKRSVEIIWPHYPFDLLVPGQATYIIKDPNDINADIKRTKDACKQYLRNPKAKITSGENKGMLKEFRIVEDVYSPVENDPYHLTEPTPCIIIWRGK